MTVKRKRMRMSKQVPDDWNAITKDRRSHFPQKFDTASCPGLPLYYYSLFTHDPTLLTLLMVVLRLFATQFFFFFFF